MFTQLKISSSVAILLFGLGVITINSVKAFAQTPNKSLASSAASRLPLKPCNVSGLDRAPQLKASVGRNNLECLAFNNQRL